MFSEMIDDVVLETSLQSHREISRSRSVCDVCHMKYVSALLPFHPSPLISATVNTKN
jgi:hypothetical protein